MAAVPDDKTATLEILLYVASSVSKPSTLFPKGAIQFKSNASFMYFCSFPLLCGDDSTILCPSGILSLLNNFFRYSNYSNFAWNIFSYYSTCTDYRIGPYLNFRQDSPS